MTVCYFFIIQDRQRQPYVLCVLLIHHILGERRSLQGVEGRIRSGIGIYTTTTTATKEGEDGNNEEKKRRKTVTLISFEVSMRYIMVHNGIEPVPDGILQRFPHSQQSNEYNECLSGKFLTKYVHY